MQVKIKHLGNFLIKDDVRNEDGSSKYFHEIQEFLLKYTTFLYGKELSGIKNWQYYLAVENLAYGIVNEQARCVDLDIEEQSTRVYSWLDIKFMLNLENILK